MKKKSLTFYREQAKLSIEQLAKKVGVSQRCVRYWESDREILKNAKVKNVVKLCKVLKISVEELI